MRTHNPYSVKRVSVTAAPHRPLKDGIVTQENHCLARRRGPAARSLPRPLRTGAPFAQSSTTRNLVRANFNIAPPALGPGRKGLSP